MPFLGRRMARAAVVGGVAYHAGSRRAQNQANEVDQEARIEDLEAQQQPAPAAAAAPAEPDYTEELEQIAKLHEQGILTDDEFAAKKKEILGI